MNHLKEIIGWEHSDLPNIQLLTIFNNDFNCSYLEKTLRHFPQNVSLKTNSSRILLHTDNGSNLYGIRCIDKDHQQKNRTNLKIWKIEKSNKSKQQPNIADYKDFVQNILSNTPTEEKKDAQNDNSIMQIIRDCFIVFACCACIAFVLKKMFYDHRLSKKPNRAEGNLIYFQHKENQDLRQSSTTLNTLVTNKDDI